MESNEVPTQSTQCDDAAKSGQRWEEKEILMLLSCYEKFLSRFQKKRESEKRIWSEVIELFSFSAFPFNLCVSFLYRFLI